MSKSKILQGMYDRHYNNITNKPCEETIESAYDGGKEQSYQGLLESIRRVDNFRKPESQIKEQVVYKLQHKYTKLFYDPKGSYQTVTEVGKVYSRRKPARQSHITIPYELRGKYDSQYHNAQTKLDDWEVISYKLIEIKE